MKNIKLKIFLIVLSIISIIGIKDNIFAAETQYGNIEISILGEQITSSRSSEIIVEGYSYWVTQPIASESGIQNIHFLISAKENIYSPDNETIYQKGQIIATLTTDEYGYATYNNLPFGQYTLTEYNPESGKLLIDTPVNFNVDSTETLHLENRIVGNSITSNLVFLFENADISYIGATYGIYAKNSLKDSRGNILIYNDELIDVFSFDDELQCTVNLPKGSYYVKQLYSPYPYELSTEETTINIEETGLRIPCILKDLNNIYNVLYIAPYTYYNDKDKEQKLQAFKEMLPDEVITYSYEQGCYIPDMTYNLYSDENHTKLVKSFNTTTYGFAKCEDLLAGEYYATVEVNSNNPYELDDLGKIEIINNKDWATIIYHGLKEEELGPPAAFLKLCFYNDDGTVRSKLNSKEEFEMSNVLFEIYEDSKGSSILMRSVTDETGHAMIPYDLFEENKTYYITTIDYDTKDFITNLVPYTFKAGNNEISIGIQVDPVYGLLGDIDDNGVIDANDASLVLEMYKSEIWTKADLPLADMDNNKVIDANDASLILEYYKVHN